MAVQKIPLGGGFYAFGHHFQAQAFGQGEMEAQMAASLRSVSMSFDKRAVDFQHVYRQQFQVARRE